MEYRGYTPNEVKKDKRKNMFFIILLILPLLIGAILVMGSVIEWTSTDVEDISDYLYTGLTEGEAYYIDELILVDTFAYYGNTTTGYAEDTYYIVCFFDRKEELVYTAIKLENTSDLSETCEAYVEDESLGIGDVVLSGCFVGYESGSSVDSYFEEAYEMYNEQLPGKKLNWNFTYEAKDQKEYASQQLTGTYVLLGLGAVFVIASVIGMVCLIRKRKELDRYIAEYNGETFM